MIILEPTGGLCSRMRTIDATVGYAKHTGEKVILIWTLNKSLNCSLHKLFENINEISLIIQLRGVTCMGRAVRRLLKLTIRFICHDYYLPSDMDRLMATGIDFQKFHQKKNLYLRTDHCFFQSRDPFQIFKPVRSLKKIIDSYQINEQYVGIHVRRTDNLWSNYHSPTPVFISRMQEEIDRNPATRFFISSDSLEEKKALANRFPDRTIYYKQDSFNRDIALNIQNAVIDLYLLSRCRKIIGSYGSCYTFTAHRISNNELEIILSDLPCKC